MKNLGNREIGIADNEEGWNEKRELKCDDTLKVEFVHVMVSEFFALIFAGQKDTMKLRRSELREFA